MHTENQNTLFILAFNLSWKLIGNETHEMSPATFFSGGCGRLRIRRRSRNINDAPACARLRYASLRMNWSIFPHEVPPPGWAVTGTEGPSSKVGHFSGGKKICPSVHFFVCFNIKVIQVHLFPEPIRGATGPQSLPGYI